ncbi:MAG: AIR synthase-related protein, partial [candidate division WOR-3 bacterium]
MIWRIEVNKVTSDPEELLLECKARELGLCGLAPIRLTKVYYLEGNVSREQAERAAVELFCDPICETCRVVKGNVGGTGIEIAYNSGVTDPSVESIERALADMGLFSCRVRTSRIYEVSRVMQEEERDLLVLGVLMNPVVQHVSRPGEDLFDHHRSFRFCPRYVRLIDCPASTLEQISREGMLALNLAEMRAIQRYFRRAGRNPTDAELETLAQTWSEHCQHKTFRGRIVINGRTIDNLLKSTIFRVQEELRYPWVLSAFHDNSGAIEFDANYAITFKVETHNHPSALEPYGGAATGVGGVIRDCLGTGLGAKPILNTDVFCLGYVTRSPEEVPQGAVHPKRFLRGVVAGVRDYGNRMGIPTANGAVFFDDGFLGNPLVFCGTLGVIPRDKIKKRVRKGQAIVLLGGCTGRDGVHGVTFASLALGEIKSEAGSTVQIGNPIEEKRLQDLVLAARDRGLFSAITDCGGGGLSSAVGELTARHGCEVWLERVPLKYQGLAPAEIWISEAQERMIVLSEPSVVDSLLELARSYDVRATVIGRVTDTRRLQVYYRNRLVVDIGMHFLHNGWRVTTRTGHWCQPDVPEPFVRSDQDLNDVLLNLLSSPNIASKEWITRQYDHEVQAGSAMKPLTDWEGRGPTDACVVVPFLDSKRGCVVACGIRPRLGLIDPYWMAASAIDEALRNCVAAGGDIERTALLDNFCWGSPERPEQLGGLVRAAEACY